MSSFELRKPLVGEHREYSSGIGNLPLGKVNPNVLETTINSGKGMALRDSTWSKSAANTNQGVTINLNIRSNNVTDVSGNGNHPTLSDVTLLNGEMQFNGTTSIATITRNAGIETSNVSIFMRVKYNSFGTGIGRFHSPRCRLRRASRPGRSR